MESENPSPLRLITIPFEYLFLIFPSVLFCEFEQKWDQEFNFVVLLGGSKGRLRRVTGILNSDFQHILFLIPKKITTSTLQGDRQINNKTLTPITGAYYDSCSYSLQKNCKTYGLNVTLGYINFSSQKTN